jgi:hypothetical protein
VEALGFSILSHSFFPSKISLVLFPEPDPTAEEKDVKKRTKHLPKRGLFVVDGEFVPATLIEGLFVRSNGTLLTVVESMGGGAVLRTDDGALWSVPSYDRFDTSYWLSPYKIIVASNELYMYYLKKGKKIWVKRIK